MPVSYPHLDVYKRQLSDSITMGKIDKVYQPESDELVLNIHTKNGNRKLFASVNPAASRLHPVSYTHLEVYKRQDQEIYDGISQTGQSVQDI